VLLKSQKGLEEVEHRKEVRIGKWSKNLALNISSASDFGISRVRDGALTRQKWLSQRLELGNLR